MEDEEDVSFHLPYDALPQASQPHDLATFCRAQWRVDGAQQRRADDAGALERLADDARRQCLEVNRDVGQLRHACATSAPSSAWCRPGKRTATSTCTDLRQSSHRSTTRRACA